MAEQLFVALYTDADVIPKSANGEERRSLICLFASPQSLPRADYHGPMERTLCLTGICCFSYPKKN